MPIICSFFGHRNISEKTYLELHDEIERHILKKNTDTFYVGSYGFFDNMASDILCEMKKTVSADNGIPYTGLYACDWQRNRQVSVPNVISGWTRVCSKKVCYITPQSLDSR